MCLAKVSNPTGAEVAARVVGELRYHRGEHTYGVELISSAPLQVLALKTLCGFDIREIALRLLSSEANIYKRLGRGRSLLRDHSYRFLYP